MFHTLDDYKDKNRDEKAEKDKRKTTDSYTGGKSSGIAVENPEEDDWLKKVKKHDDKEKYGKTKNKLKLTVYKNGFIIDDGEFRNKDEPANKKFMEEVEKGYIPNELVKKGNKNQMKLEEDFFKLAINRQTNNIIELYEDDDDDCIIGKDKEKIINKKIQEKILVYRQKNRNLSLKLFIINSQMKQL